VLARLGWPGGTGSGPRPGRLPGGTAAPHARWRSTPGPRGRAPRDAHRSTISAAEKGPTPGEGDAAGPGARASPVGEAAAPVHQRVLEALGWEPALLDDVARRSGLGLPAVVIALESLYAGVRSGATAPSCAGRPPMCGLCSAGVGRQPREQSYRHTASGTGRTTLRVWLVHLPGRRRSGGMSAPARLSRPLGRASRSGGVRTVAAPSPCEDRGGGQRCP